MIHVRLIDHAGKFAENKDVARDLRLKHIAPALENNEKVVLDFSGIDSATQSFVHALISDLIRRYKPAVLDRIDFKGCNETVKKVVTLVADYMQESELDSDEPES